VKLLHKNVRGPSTSRRIHGGYTQVRVSALASHIRRIHVRRTITCVTSDEALGVRTCAIQARDLATRRDAASWTIRGLDRRQTGGNKEYLAEEIVE
jgi:hypothetical protein